MASMATACPARASAKQLPVLAQHKAGCFLQPWRLTAVHRLVPTAWPTPLRVGQTRRGRACLATRAQLEVQSPPVGQAPPKQEPVRVDGVEAVQVTGSTICLRGSCRERLKYEVEYGLKRGTTDNSYLIKGKDGKTNVLVDVPDKAFTADFVQALERSTSLRDVRHIVLTHLTPTRIDSIKEVLQRRQAGSWFGGKPGPLDIHLSNPALQLLQSSLGGEQGKGELLAGIELRVAKAGALVEGEGVPKLRLIPVPTPRWPDLLCVYHAADRMLLTSKLFGAHVAPATVGAETPYDVGGWATYGNDWRYYYDCMLAPVARQARSALEKLDTVVEPSSAGGGLLTALAAGLVQRMRSAAAALESSQAAAFGTQVMGIKGAPSMGAMPVSLLCPMHGPVVQSSVAELMRQYLAWTQAQVAVAEQCRIAVLYASAYGNTAALAQAIARGITKAGVGVEMLNLEQETLDDVAAAVNQCSGFVIGSPTLGGHMPTQVTTALGAILRDAEAKEMPCGVFGSFGWSGEAVDELEKRLKDAGFQFSFDAIRVKFKPTGKDLQVCEESGTDLAQAVRKRLQRREKQASASSRPGASGAEAALGRVVGSLCVVTARQAEDDGAASGMLASWVSQASFNPPGLSVSVKKDRAVDGLLLPGTPFVLNILADGAEKPIVKHMLKAFKPGEDRFEGLPTRPSEATGGVIIEGSAAAVECTVRDRMEAGDHYVVYASVEGGQVLTESALSAVHHRKSGTTY